MTQLLVSVRSGQEARQALAGGADIIDVKEPSRGSLGAAAVEVWREVASEVAGACPLSVALGEYRDLSRPPDFASLHGYAFAKLGLAGFAGLPDWTTRLKAVFDQFPSWLQPVAVAYADYEHAECPPLIEVCRAAVSLRCPVMLIDTYCKASGDLFDAASWSELAETLKQARRWGLKSVLAGSLRLDCLESALSLEPDIIAVRGAVCQTGRESNLDESLVRQWAQRCHGEPVRTE